MARELVTDPTEPIGLGSSVLMRRAVNFDDTHVDAYYQDGDYGEVELEKAEAESRVAVLETRLDRYEPQLLALYLRGMFLPDEIEGAGTPVGRRQRAFAALQLEFDVALNALDVKRMEDPARTDPLFTALPKLWPQLTAKDRMLVLRPELIDDDQAWRGAMPALTVGDHAVYLHPRLAALGELVVSLAELAEDPDLVVSVAVDPFRITTAEEFAPRILEDYWKGIQLTPETVDSLDDHDVGNPTFHAAGERDPVIELFNPMIGTWFDWDRRGDDPSDPVKRLYIQEVGPPHDRRGGKIESVINLELHAERDTSARAFVHVDGKAAAYDVTSYSPSVETPMVRPGKPHHSRKLWRVDGRLSNETWLSLVGDHFRGNELIAEHFAEAFGPPR